MLPRLAAGIFLPSASYPHTEDDENETKGVWLKGHTGQNILVRVISPGSDHFPDFGSLTILWSQPVSALQIKGQDGKRHHMDNALVCSGTVISLDHILYTLDRLSTLEMAWNFSLVVITKEPPFTALSNHLSISVTATDMGSSTPFPETM